MLPNGIDPRRGGWSRCPATGRRRRGRGHATGPAQAAAAPAPDAARMRGAWFRRRPAAGRHRRRGPRAWPRWSVTCDRHGMRGLGASCRAGCRATRSGTSTGGPTSSSRRPTWSRSGSPRSRPAAPACRWWRWPRTGIREFVLPTRGAAGRLGRRRWSPRWPGWPLAPHLRHRIAEHNRAVPPALTWDDVLPRSDAVYRQGGRPAQARVAGRPRSRTRRAPT